MSRLKKFTRSLWSGYLMLGANIFYTFASVPLALHYLGKTEFGLIALISQIAIYIALIDLGMAGSVARFLIDYKDERQTGDYGSVIKTGALVGLVQGALIVVVGVLLSTLAGSLMQVPTELRREFVGLMIGQAILMGIAFATRIFGHLLSAHQRLDVSNHGASVGFFLNLATMWIGFACGLGIYGFLLGQAVMVIANACVNAVACVRLGLLPRHHEWGRATRARFQELFAFSNDMFVYTLGLQLINASQTILITALLGLDVAAVWSICTRAYTVLTMLVWRILDYSMPTLAEMIVRGERDRLRQRLREIAVLTAGLSLVGGTLFALGNDPFVRLWTAGKISWPPVNDALLAAWFFICTVMRTFTYFIGATKQLKFIRFIFLVEGSVFIGLNLLADQADSMTLMLVFSLLCTLTFSLPLGLRRVRNYFGMGWRELAGWFRPTWRLAGWFVPFAVIVGWLARGLPLEWQLVLNVTVPGLWGAVILLRYGLDDSLREDIFRHLPNWARPAFVKFGFYKAKASL